MTFEFTQTQVENIFRATVHDCPHCTFNVVDMDNYKEQMETEMIHSFLIIPQWTERPRKKSNNTFSNLIGGNND
jgi:hypothetical protein